MLSDKLIMFFLIVCVGYAVGRIRIKDINLGTSGILLTALVFGHFGVELPDMIQSIGMALFITVVGYMAGPAFLRNLKSNFKAYALISICIVLSGVLVCLAIIRLSGLSVDLALGLLAGALTSTPGFAAGLEATGSDLVSVGYGVAYPFGVISVVLFVQIIPKLLKVDLKKERAAGKESGTQPPLQFEKSIRLDQQGLFTIAASVILGDLIGRIAIPLSGGGSFSLGTSGGCLLAGILLGFVPRIGEFDLRIEKGTLLTMREMGLVFFLVGAGTNAGQGFVEVLKQNGLILFLYGAVMAVIPMAVGLLMARKVFRLSFLDTLGTICGGMTSTPALGALISSSGTEDVSYSYAAAYPFALATVILSIGFIAGRAM